MDAFKTVIVVAVALLMVSLVFISVVTQDATQNAKTPDEEYGLVTAKAPVANISTVTYSVGLSNGKTLYIPTNTTLYDSIAVNKTYLFNCRLDFTNHITLIDSATQTNRTT